MSNLDRIVCAKQLILLARVVLVPGWPNIYTNVATASHFVVDVRKTGRRLPRPSILLATRPFLYNAM